MKPDDSALTPKWLRPDDLFVEELGPPRTSERVDLAGVLGPLMLHRQPEHLRIDATGPPGVHESLTADDLAQALLRERDAGRVLRELCLDGRLPV